MMHVVVSILHIELIVSYASKVPQSDICNCLGLLAVELTMETLADGHACLLRLEGVEQDMMNATSHQVTLKRRGAQFATYLVAQNHPKWPIVDGK